MKYKNTLQRGSVRFIIFRDGDTWYGTCLEFNIVEEGSTPREAYILLSEAVIGYLESARKIKTRPHILNQRTDPEYEMLWNSLQEKGRKKVEKKVFSFGSLNIPQLVGQAV